MRLHHVAYLRGNCFASRHAPPSSKGFGNGQAVDRPNLIRRGAQHSDHANPNLVDSHGPSRRCWHHRRHRTVDAAWRRSPGGPAGPPHRPPPGSRAGPLSIRRVSRVALDTGKTPHQAVWPVVAANFAWAAGCVAVLLSGQVEPNGLGVAFILVQAVAVLIFADLQVV